MGGLVIRCGCCCHGSHACLHNTATLQCSWCKLGDEEGPTVGVQTVVDQKRHDPYVKGSHLISKIVNIKLFTHIQQLLRILSYSRTKLQ